jgi:putative rhamnosyltransferase
MLPSTNRFRHLILTRFNVRIEQCDRQGLDWLEHRFDIFERFCFPSVRSQTNTNFDWIVFFHPEVPKGFRGRIQAYCACSAFRPIYFRSMFSQAMVQAAISDLLEGFTHVITTRLDNDDAISTRFVDTIQKHFRGQDFEFLNFTNGYIWAEGRLFFGQHHSNPFISLVERTGNCSTVYCGNHMDLGQVGPIAQIEGPPAWLQVVHGQNLSNCVWGEARPLLEAHQDFPACDIHSEPRP